MPKPGGCHSSGISLGDALRLPKRHPAWRRREAQSGSCMERENLAGDAKGKAQAAPTVRPKVPMRRRGADCPVAESDLLHPVCDSSQQQFAAEVRRRLRFVENAPLLPKLAEAELGEAQERLPASRCILDRAPHACSGAAMR